jgi:hypothetical protein
MPGANWAQPTTGTAYASVPADILALATDAVSLFQNAGLGSNLPAYAIRFNAAAFRLEVTPGGGSSPTDWRGLACYTPWNDCGAATYSSANQFLVSGNQTALFTVGRRVQLLDSATLTGTVTAASFSTPNTLVTVALDTGSLSTHLSDVLVSVTDAAALAMPQLPARAMAWDAVAIAVSGTSFPAWTQGALYDCTNTSAAAGTLPNGSGAAIAATPGYCLSFKASGSAPVTLSASTTSSCTDTIDGQAAIVLYPGDEVSLYLAAVGMWRNRAMQHARPSMPSVARAANATLTVTADGGTLQRVSGTCTLTLPQTGSGAGKARDGMEIAFLVTAGATTLTIARGGTDTIAGNTSLTVNAQWSGLTLKSDGAGHWDIVGLTGAGAIGSAAAKAASNTGLATLASVSGTVGTGDVAVFTDTSGTIGDGGSPWTYSIPVAIVLG